MNARDALNEYSGVPGWRTSEHVTLFCVTRFILTTLSPVIVGRRAPIYGSRKWIRMVKPHPRYNNERARSHNTTT